MIDCDIHHLVGDVEEFLGYVEPGQREWFRSRGQLLGLPDYPWTHPVSWFRADASDGAAGPGTSLAALRSDLLEPLGTDIGVLNADDGVAVSLMANALRAGAFARAHNDWVRERWLDEEPRLRASILCPAQDPAAAAAEIARAAADERFLQVLLPGGSERPYGDPRYLPIFEAAAEAGLVVAIHSGGEGMGIAAPPGGAGTPSFYIEWHTLGSACSVMSHLVSLLCHGVFERLPKLRVLLIEGGIAWLPGILWRLDTNWRALRAEVPWLSRRPSEVVRDRVRFATQPLEHTAGRDELLFEMLAEAGAPDILCFSSDYPHWDFDEPVQLERRLPPAWRRAVMHENAAALYAARLAEAASPA